MHFTFIFVAMLVSFPTTRSHPTSVAAEERNEPNQQRARPVQQFFTNILNALRPTTTTEPPTTMGGDEKPSSFHTNVEFEEIPNFVDYSTFLLNSLASNNSAINFAFMQPNTNGTSTERGNYSMITFLIPHDDKATSGKLKGIFSYFTSLRLPWSKDPTNTDFSQFPPILEYFTQRIQTYFSVYKYSDDSRFNNTIVIFSPKPQQHDDESSISSENILSDEEISTTTTNDYQTETMSIVEEDTTTAIANETE